MRTAHRSSSRLLNFQKPYILLAGCVTTNPRAHSGIPGNENADRGAKLSTAKEDENNWVTYEDIKFMYRL